jgi:hypothetical protein
MKNFLQSISSMDNRKLIILTCTVSAALLMWPREEKTQKLHPPMIVNSPPPSCIQIRPEGQTYQEAVTREPGTYCAVADFWQRRLYGAGHSGPGEWRSLISIEGGDVTIDLMNHTLHSDGDSSGVSAFLRPNVEYLEALKQRKNITIKNGVLDLRGLGKGVNLANLWRAYSIDQAAPKNLIVYAKTNFILDNLLIKTDSIGIILEGEGNVIRNCIIESNGRAAIMMAGPNGLIENNTIVLSNKFMPGLASFTFAKFMEGTYSLGNIYNLLDERREPKAAIVLHQGTGTVIRRNRIEVKGKSETRHTIYITDASRDVHVDRNTIIGTDDPVTLAKESTAILKDNVLEQ